jgi:hypothetical protein
MDSTIWIITAMLWFEGINEPRHTEYNLAQFTGRDSQKYDTTISGDLTPQCKIFYKFRNRGGNGRNWLKCMNLLHKQSTAAFFKAVDGGRVVQFFPVFQYLACEANLFLIFLRGRPKSPLIV